MILKIRSNGEEYKQTCQWLAQNSKLVNFFVQTFIYPILQAKTSQFKIELHIR